MHLDDSMFSVKVTQSRMSEKVMQAIMKLKMSVHSPQLLTKVRPSILRAGILIRATFGALLSMLRTLCRESDWHVNPPASRRLPAMTLRSIKACVLSERPHLVRIKYSERKLKFTWNNSSAVDSLSAILWVSAFVAGAERRAADELPRLAEVREGFWDLHNSIKMRFLLRDKWNVSWDFPSMFWQFQNFTHMPHIFLCNKKKSCNSTKTICHFCSNTLFPFLVFNRIFPSSLSRYYFVDFLSHSRV